MVKFEFIAGRSKKKKKFEAETVVNVGIFLMKYVIFFFCIFYYLYHYCSLCLRLKLEIQLLGDLVSAKVSASSNVEISFHWSVVGCSNLQRKLCEYTVLPFILFTYFEIVVYAIFKYIIY